MNDVPFDDEATDSNASYSLMRLGDMWTGTEIGTDDVAVDDACVSAVLVARTVVVDTSTTAKVVEPVDEALSEDEIFVSVVVVDIESSELVVAKESMKEDVADTTEAYEKLGENRTRPNARERVKILFMFHDVIL